LHTRLTALLVIAVLSSFGCDESDRKSLLVNRGVGPSLLPSDLLISRGFVVQPAFVDARRVGAAVCPTHPPFLAPFNVVFDGHGQSDLFLSRVQMQFMDTTGIPAGTMTLGEPELATRFGSTIVPAFGTRTFPFAFPFGCAGLPTGTLTVVVVAGDSLGRERRMVRHVDIR
ncbi:MAG: hypothetical protein ACRD3C_17635, partial [Vicinamibacterales bacterium]